MFDADDELEQQYRNLKPKQKAIIDAHAENPDYNNREKTNVAINKLKQWIREGTVSLDEVGADTIEEVSINESYNTQVINSNYAKLAKYREEIEQNQRQEGTMQTEGNPFKAIPQDDSGFQSIQDRPVKETQSQDTEPPSQESQAQPAVAQQPVQVREDVDGVLLKIDYRYLRELLVDQETKLPDELQARLVDVLVERARNVQTVES